MATMNAPTIDRRQTPDRRSVEGDHASGAIIALDYIAMALMIIGGLNWAMVGLFQVDLVATLFGPASPPARLIYVMVGVAALWGVYLLGKLASNNGRS
ncbi:DUF378 domain-containing protein [Massilia sp. S19_KUP03_FR1]|uniref:DUF378 domain-containing protein n=1 Tax=Massilia sp. S19_KUP03_FR1 TaxID=3025503 RepID=UPI002FCDD40F